VIDFGLARRAEAEDVEMTVGARVDPSLADADAPALREPPSVTMTIGAERTADGAILGSAAYMSPEQARGEPVDRRADIWAFGVVLFEMISGRRPFEATDTAGTLAQVVSQEPVWAALPAETPTSIRRLLARCLAKDRRQRLHDISDARLEVDEALTPTLPAEAKDVPRPGWWSRALWLIAAAGLSMAAGAAM
jgi:serine/threonine protein kinase